MKNVEQTIKSLVEKKAGTPVTSAEQDLRNDLGLDSLDIVELFMDIDLEFKVDIPDDIWREANVMTIKDLSTTVQNYLERQ